MSDFYLLYVRSNSRERPMRKLRFMSFESSTRTVCNRLFMVCMKMKTLVLVVFNKTLTSTRRTTTTPKIRWCTLDHNLTKIRVEGTGEAICVLDCVVFL